MECKKGWCRIVRAALVVMWLALGISEGANAQSPISGATQVVAGVRHTCALVGGGVKCWGDNSGGQLGDNSTTRRLTAVDVVGLTSGVTAIGAGRLHACALTTVGGVKCWGLNYNGQLGDGSAVQRLTAVDVVGLTSGVTAIAVGAEHTCALTKGGGIKCWGNNYYGQLGDNTTTLRLTAVDVAGLASGIKAIAAGSAHTCALTMGGGVKCWGQNLSGQLGDNSRTDRLVAVDAMGLTGGAAAIAAGGRHTCVLTTVGGAKCWGDNYYGQLGDGSTAPQLTAVDAVGLTSGVAAIAAGDRGTCVVTLGGEAKCWGDNDFGQLGDTTTTRQLTSVRVTGLASGVLAIAAGELHNCALTTGGGVQCWGYNRDGRLGTGSTNERLTAVDVTGLTSGMTTSAPGDRHTCAVTSGGGAKCWGDNRFGQVGDNSSTQRLTAVDATGLTAGVAAIATGSYHNCALTTGGGVKCWGYNGSGRLGDGSQTWRLAAVDVSGLTSGVKAIAAGGVHTCALTIGGGVKCWGDNLSGQLGDNSTIQRLTAVDVTGLTSGVMSIAAGGLHTCALTAVGGVKCWGANFSGQLGDNSGTDRLTAVDVAGLTSGVTAIATGGDHTCALISGGGVKCWGWNSSGQLGDNSAISRFTAVDVVGLTNGVTAIAAGGHHTCALMSGGGVKCWGGNSFGQLGDNSIDDRHSAVDVMGLPSGVTAIAAGYAHNCALTSGGGVKCWGSNSDGQLGDGTFDAATPFPVTVLQVNTAPGAPVAVAGTSGNAQVSLSWTAPASNGGSAITGYNVQVASSAGGTYANVGAGTCMPATANASTATTCIVAGLTNGVTYYFKVAAINGLGMGSYSGASSGVTPATVVEPPPPPVIPTLPVSVPGMIGTASIADLSSADGPAFLAAMTGMLRSALSSNLQFVEQTPQGTVVLRGYQGSSLAFIPHGYQSGDIRVNGIYPLGDGSYQVVNNGTSLTIAPALRSPDQLVALLPGAQVVQGQNGVLTAYVGGVAYVVQPSIHVLSVSATGSARLLVGADGYYRFIDAQGNEQTLYPAFREPGVLRAVLAQIDPIASLLINFDGTAAAQVFGRSWVLVPDLILAPMPGERQGQAWWQETGVRYRYANSQFQPVSGMSQGLTLR